MTTEKEKKAARKEFAKVQWGDFWEDCLTAYEYELEQPAGPRQALREANNYHDYLAADRRQYQNQFEDAPAVYDTMSGGSYTL